MFLNIQIDLLILKTYFWQFTLTTKKSLHIIFKEAKYNCITCERIIRLNAVAVSGRCLQWFWHCVSSHVVCCVTVLSYHLLLMHIHLHAYACWQMAVAMHCFHLAVTLLSVQKSFWYLQHVSGSAWITVHKYIYINTVWFSQVFANKQHLLQ